ncbi:uncharacterized protein DNG_05059 [Cephalotrichum gorgonifer]|uniref:Uncharacterized protein n=1 Tax=Cephalotrichum gorgonifer TaxID=2041049 RepID=A0AAE8SV69_9PEZI|nr:uncharacterized protein DNG_05059 [Cephalotrichum gorgonifer]
MSSENGQDPCSFEGNADLYGLGIRVGVYLQTISLVMASIFGQTATLNKMNYACGIFQFALTVGLCILSTSSSEFRSVEAALVVLLALCSSFQAPSFADSIIMRRPWTLKKVQAWVQDAGLPIFRVLVEFALILYSVWFWFRGLDVLSHSDTCTAYAFFFSRVDLYGWFRTLGKVYIIYKVAIEAVATALWLKHRLSSKKPDNSLPNDTLVSNVYSAWDILERHAHRFTGVVQLVLVLFFALSVELMIRWNGITSVSGLGNVGQLIALLVGLGVLISVALEWEHGESRPLPVDGRYPEGDTGVRRVGIRNELLALARGPSLRRAGSESTHG